MSSQSNDLITRIFILCPTPCVCMRYKKIICLPTVLARRSHFCRHCWGIIKISWKNVCIPFFWNLIWMFSKINQVCILKPYRSIEILTIWCMKPYANIIRCIYFFITFLIMSCCHSEFASNTINLIVGNSCFIQRYYIRINIKRRRWPQPLCLINSSIWKCPASLRHIKYNIRKSKFQPFPCLSQFFIVRRAYYIQIYTALA